MIGIIPEAEYDDLCAHCPAIKGHHAMITLQCPNPKVESAALAGYWLNTNFELRPTLRCKHCDMGQDWHSSTENCPAVPGARNRGYRSRTFELPRTSWDRLLGKGL